MCPLHTTRNIRRLVRHIVFLGKNWTKKIPNTCIGVKRGEGQQKSAVAHNVHSSTPNLIYCTFLEILEMSITSSNHILLSNENMAFLCSRNKSFWSFSLAWKNNAPVLWDESWKLTQTCLVRSLLAHILIVLFNHIVFNLRFRLWHLFSDWKRGKYEPIRYFRNRFRLVGQ